MELKERCLGGTRGLLLKIGWIVHPAEWKEGMAAFGHNGVGGWAKMVRIPQREEVHASFDSSKFP